MATIRYLVNDVQTSIEFYTGLLGFDLIEQMGPAFAIVARGALSLWLSGQQTSAARLMPARWAQARTGWLESLRDRGRRY